MTNRILQRLTNPFALTAQGFALGAVLFFAINGDKLEAQPAHPSVTSAAPH